MFAQHCTHGPIPSIDSIHYCRQLPKQIRSGLINFRVKFHNSRICMDPTRTWATWMSKQTDDQLERPRSMTTTQSVPRIARAPITTSTTFNDATAEGRLGTFPVYWVTDTPSRSKRNCDCGWTCWTYDPNWLRGCEWIYRIHHLTGRPTS